MSQSVFNVDYIQFRTKCKLQWHWTRLLVAHFVRLETISAVYASSMISQTIKICQHVQNVKHGPDSQFPLKYWRAQKYCAAISYFMLWYAYQCYHWTACRFQQHRMKIVHVRHLGHRKIQSIWFDWKWVTCHHYHRHRYRYHQLHNHRCYCYIIIPLVSSSMFLFICVPHVKMRSCLKERITVCGYVWLIFDIDTE